MRLESILSMHTETSMIIARVKGELSTISVVMPIWIKREDFISISIPMLMLKTVASNEEDINKAIEGTIKCFCIAAEKFGKGLEAELEALGWEKNDSSLEFSMPDNEVIEEILKTGQMIALKDLLIAA